MLPSTSEPSDLLLSVPAVPSAATPNLQIAHVLFMDIVAYSVLTMNAQGAVQVELQNVVGSVPEVQQAKARRDGLIIRPTGDGMALLFFHDLLSPVRCAVEISDALNERAAEIKARTGAQIRLRMGIHSGPVLMVEDLNRQADVAGDGIVIARRIMDCGDAGHILLSADVAHAIEKIQPWARWLHDLGTCAVKHHVHLHLYTLCGRTIGAKANFGHSVAPVHVAHDQAERRVAAQKHEVYLAQMDATEQRRPYFRSLWLLIGVLCLIGIVGTVWRKVDPENFHAAVARLRESLPHWQSASSAVKVPSFKGWPLADVQHWGEKQGVKIASSNQSNYDSQPLGFIYYQDPKAETYATASSTIFVRVSKGPRPLPNQSAVPADESTPPWQKPAVQRRKKTTTVAQIVSDPAPPTVPITESPEVSEPPAVAPRSEYTGVLINAQHLSQIESAQAPAILGMNETGETRLYPDAGNDWDTIDTNASGWVRYFYDEDSARRGVCGSNPCILRAEAVVFVNGRYGAVRLSKANSDKWREVDAALQLTKSHKVGFLMPSKK